MAKKHEIGLEEIILKWEIILNSFFLYIILDLYL